VVFEPLLCDSVYLIDLDVNFCRYRSVDTKVTKLQIEHCVVLNYFPCILLNLRDTKGVK
jgi:hypothetical protein